MSAQIVRELSAEDLSILTLETETVVGHTCKVIVLGDQIDPDLLRASIAGRLDRALPLCLCLSEIGGEPCWVLDPNVDLDAHVVVHHAPEPVDMTELRVAVARIFERRLDRSRPLWQIDVIPRLTGGGSALLWRVHHALVDGSTAMRVAETALWDEGLSSGAAAEKPAHPVSITRTEGPVAKHWLGGLGAAAREAPHWHRSPFDGHIDARRAVAFASVELEGLRRAARAADGATVNDAVLTVVAGGLRRWLESHHGHLGEVRVKVPVSLHDPGGRGEEAAPGNRDSFFCLDLPLGPADPLARMHAIRRATRVRKQGHDAQHLDAFMRRLAVTPQLRGFAERVLANRRSFALNVSNVRGPRQSVHVLGAPVRALYSLAEIREHHALRIAVVSLANALNFGFTADPTLVPDVDRLARHTRADAEALLGRPVPV